MQLSVVSNGPSNPPLTSARIEERRGQAWCASTITSLLVAGLLLAILDHGGNILLGVGLVAVITIPFATRRALGACAREALQSDLSGSGIVGAHVAVGFAFGALVPAGISAAVAIVAATGMLVTGGAQSATSVLAFGFVAAMGAALAGFLLSLPVSMAGGVAAVLALRGSASATEV